MQTQYDVIIAGGGLAGLTLAIQLKGEKPDISILILESRESEAITAAHKVGESTVELASYYFREVLKLKDYLEEHELPKHGLRFFFKSNTKEDITSRVELGPKSKLTVPSHQLDRGTLENHLAKRAQELGATLISGAKVRDVAISADNGHQLTYTKGGEELDVTAKWVADATGRSSFLKRKLKFKEPLDHAVNAVWWRVKGVVDVDDWSDNEKWQKRLEPKLRYLSTVHFMDEGYWVWIIPLGSKNTSIGIVADPAYHAFEDINKYDKAMAWLEKNEPLCYEKFKPFGEEDGLLDFKVLKHFAHNSGELYSGKERWGVVGEAGAFLDPFYSPGSDFIAMANTWLSDLILRDLDGEDVEFRAGVYQQAHLANIENWLPIYQNQYSLMGHSQIMTVKIFWDWAVYWSVPCLLFTNKAYTNLRAMKTLFGSATGEGRKLGELNNTMQKFFLEWRPHDTEVFSDRIIDPYDVDFLRNFQIELELQQGNNLIPQVEKNMRILEKAAAAIYRLVSSQVNGTSDNVAVDPYAITINYNEVDHKNGLLPDDVMTKDVSIMWFYQNK